MRQLNSLSIIPNDTSIQSLAVLLEGQSNVTGFISYLKSIEDAKMTRESAAHVKKLIDFFSGSMPLEEMPYLISELNSQNLIEQPDEIENILELVKTFNIEKSDFNENFSIMLNIIKISKEERKEIVSDTQNILAFNPNMRASSILNKLMQFGQNVTARKRIVEETKMMMKDISDVNDEDLRDVIQVVSEDISSYPQGVSEVVAKQTKILTDLVSRNISNNDQNRVFRESRAKIIEALKSFDNHPEKMSSIIQNVKSLIELTKQKADSIKPGFNDIFQNMIKLISALAPVADNPKQINSIPQSIQDLKNLVRIDTQFNPNIDLAITTKLVFPLVRCLDDPLEMNLFEQTKKLIISINTHLKNNSKEGLSSSDIPNIIFLIEMPRAKRVQIVTDIETLLSFPTLDIVSMLSILKSWNKVQEVPEILAYTKELSDVFSEMNVNETLKALGNCKSHDARKTLVEEFKKLLTNAPQTAQKDFKNIISEISKRQ